MVICDEGKILTSKAISNGMNLFMLASYPAIYRDQLGEVTTTIQNDGRMLRMVIRGVEFADRSFDGFEPTVELDDSQLALFTLNQGCLCSCIIECDMPLLVAFGDEVVEGILLVHLELGDPSKNGGIDREELYLTLKIGDSSFKSSGKSGGWFSDELRDIQALLPEGAYIKTCINCALADYHPVGYGLFGGLACFRNNKEAFRAAKTKRELFRIWNTSIEVQETYLCPEFVRWIPRKPG